MVRHDASVYEGEVTVEDRMTAHGPGLSLRADGGGPSYAPRSATLRTDDVEQLRDALNVWLEERGR